MSDKPINEFSRGWTILFASFIGLCVNMSTLPYYAFGVWVRPWQAEFGWTRAGIAAQQSIAVIIIMLVAPFAGRLLDRHGLRRVVPIAMVAYALCYVSIVFVNGSLLMLYAITIAYALFGVPTTPLAFTRAVNAFFVKHRGLALGVSLTASGLTAYCVPRFLTPYVAEHGWRAGYYVLFFCILAAVPVVALLIRDRPESASADGAPPPETGMSLSEALRTSVFWKLGGLFVLISTAILGIIPSFIPLLQDAGLSPTEAGSLGAVLGISVLIGRLAIGFAIDRLFAPYVTAVVFSVVALGCLTLGLGGVSYALLAAITLGFAVGAEVDLIGYYTARYFGMAHYGAVYGAQYSLFVLGAGLSPIVVGHIWDVTGSYDLALIIASVILVPAVGIALSLPRFTDRD